MCLLFTSRRLRAMRFCRRLAEFHKTPILDHHHVVIGIGMKSKTFNTACSTSLCRVNKINFLQALPKPYLGVNHGLNRLDSFNTIFNSRISISNIVMPASQTSTASVQPTEWLSKTIELPPFKRGCHVITRHLLDKLNPELSEFEVGLANIFIQHTSASLTINENASPDVPLDLHDALDKIVPDGTKVSYRHDDEGPDDMPAHVMGTLCGFSLTVPIKAGRLALGTWQGLYLNEHRNYGGPRTVVVTIQGQKRADGRKYGSYR